MKKQILVPALSGLFLVPFIAHAQFASEVVSYIPGSGFGPNFTNSSAALGAPASGSGITPFAPPFSTSQIVSIGAGGSLTLQFNTPIINNPADPFGIDLMIFGNSFFVVTGGSGSTAITSGAIFTSTVSTRVEASADGSTWFTLDPALAPNVGTLFPTDGTGSPFIPVNPALTGADFGGLNLNGIRSLYNGSAGGAGFDLSWARDGAGNSVDLQSASFLRIDVLSGRTQIDAISAVPEPGSLAVAGVGGAAALLTILRQRKTRHDA
jgi:PEP-CTERM motif